MDDLIAFLNARLDDDEQIAKAATSGPWVYKPGKAWFPDPTIPHRLRTGTKIRDIPVLALYAQISEDEFARARYGYEFVGSEGGAVATTGDTDNPEAVADAVHIARHDPARVLADVAAKRTIIELSSDATGLDMSVDLDRRVGPRDKATEPYLGDVILRTLALPYADHQDYREEWRP